MAGREGVDRSDGAYHRRVVLEVVDEATTGRVIELVRDRLPEAYRELFTAGSTGGVGRR